MTTVLPHSEEAERAVLGAILLDPELVKPASQRLRPEDFYLERHQLLFGAMVRLWAAGKPVDLLTLQAELGEHKYEQAGGIVYLSALDLNLPDLGRFDTYVEIVKERALRRELWRGAVRLIQEVVTPGEGPSLPELVEAQARDLEAVRRQLAGSGAGGYASLATIVDRTLELVEDGDGATTGQVTTGLARLDSKLAFLPRGGLIVEGGRPKLGKTAFALGVARHNAVAGRHVGVVSLEMSSPQCGTRLLSLHSGVSLGDIRRRNLTAGQWSKLVAAGKELRTLPLSLDVSRRLGVREIEARARRLHQGRPLSLLVVDYLDLIARPASTRRDDLLIGDITKSLKDLAGELDIPVLLVAQVGREGEREDRAPRLRDFAGSDAIGRDADLLLIVHRTYRTDDPSRLNDHGQIIIAGNRDDEAGSVPIVFEGWHQKFREPTSDEEDAARLAEEAKKPKRRLFG